MMSYFRTQGTKALSLVLKNTKNIALIEQAVFINSNGDDNLYTTNMYQIIGDFLAKKPLKEIFADIKSNKLGWDHSAYKELQSRLNEQDEFIENPFKVEEGVLECKAIKNGKVCGSKRVYSYTKQVRSCDEPATTFASCCACQAKWQYSG